MPRAPTKVSEAPDLKLAEEDTYTILTQICHFSFSTGSEPNGACSPNDVKLHISNSCQATAEALVQVTNLDDHPIVGESYDLPSNLPDLYYEYTFQGHPTRVIGPINSFEFRGRYAKTPSGIDYPLFEFRDHMLIDDVGNECEVSSLVNLDFQVRLIDESRELYPVESFAGLTEAFCCDVFSETCDECSSAPPSCGGGSDPIYYMTACGDCNGCGSAQANQENSPSTEPSPEGASSEQRVQMLPNPFTDNFKLTYDLPKADEVQIELLDTKGSLVYYLNKNEPAGTHHVNINAASFSTGLFFIRVKIGQKLYTEKLVKMP